MSEICNDLILAHSMPLGAVHTNRMGLRVQVQYRRISPIGELTSDPERAAVVRFGSSRIVRLPAEGSFRRLLKLLYSSIVQAGSTPFNGEPRDFGGILAQP